MDQVDVKLLVRKLRGLDGTSGHVAVVSVASDLNEGTVLVS
jgi:hypothetical protein